MTKFQQLHARYWKYDDNHPNGKDCERYDPHGFGLDLISTMVYIAEHQPECNGVSLDGVVISHHKGDSFGHQVHIAATREQWDAVKKYWEEIEDYRLSPTKGSDRTFENII